MSEAEAQPTTQKTRAEQPLKPSPLERIRSIGRVRVTQSLLALVALAVANTVAQRGFAVDWWLWVGIGTLVSSTLVEPYFTDNRSAATNSVAALGAAFGAKWSGVAPLWRLYVCLAVAVGLTSLLSMVAPPSRWQSIANWVSARFGRASLLGYGALLIEVIHATSLRASEGVTLLIGLAVAVALANLDWSRLLLMLPSGTKTMARVELAMEPNLLLVASDQRLTVGNRVNVKGKGTSDGSVVAQLAHKSGSRYQIVLDKPWRSVVDRGNADCILEVVEKTSTALGFCAEGSTERYLEIHPVSILQHGQPLALKDSTKRQLLYQVTSLRLDKNTWDSSSVIEPRAKAVQVGGPDADGTIRLAPYLPTPYQPLSSAKEMKVPLDARFKRIGVLQGTGIEIGIHPASAFESHLAILGMSGMGKTTVARRISSIFSDSSAVVAIDGTGEYLRNLRMNVLAEDPLELTTRGEWVHEPAGDPPVKCRDFIKSVMTIANLEYRGTGVVLHRTLLIEEAHSFLPEWNFATKPQSDAVNESCRFILQARKYGIGFIFVSQRTAVIAKSAVSQCENYIVFRTLDQTSLDYIESVVGKDYREAVASLKRYQAVCVGPAFNCSSPVIVDLDH